MKLTSMTIIPWLNSGESWENDDPNPARYAAPRIEFVAPEENVRIGSRSADLSDRNKHIRRKRVLGETDSAEVKVPSFWVKNNGQERPSRNIAFLNPDIVFLENAMIEALRIEAFSLSKRPNCPTKEGLIRFSVRLVVSSYHHESRRWMWADLEISSWCLWLFLPDLCPMKWCNMGIL